MMTFTTIDGREIKTHLPNLLVRDTVSQNKPTLYVEVYLADEQTELYEIDEKEYFRLIKERG